MQEGRDPQIGREASYPQMAQMTQIQEGGIRGLGKGELSADGADDADGTEGSVEFGTFLGDPAEGVSWAAVEVLSLH